MLPAKQWARCRKFVELCRIRSQARCAGSTAWMAWSGAVAISSSNWAGWRAGGIVEAHEQGCRSDFRERRRVGKELRGAVAQSSILIGERRLLACIRRQLA